MNNKPSSPANSNFSNLGIILILFILLVVVIGSFPKAQKLNETSSVVSTAGFIVRNNTFYYTLVLTGLEGETQLPEIIFMPPGGSVRFEVPSRAFQTTRANIEYTVLGDYGELGKLTFTLVNPIVFPTFSNIRTTAPINTQNTSTAYPDVTPLLIVTEKY